MDAQVFWDALGTCSCWHGVTSVVMGNCGFSLAPCEERDKLLVMRNLTAFHPYTAVYFFPLCLVFFAALVQLVPGPAQC